MDINDKLAYIISKTDQYKKEAAEYFKKIDNIKNSEDLERIFNLILEAQLMTVQTKENKEEVHFSRLLGICATVGFVEVLKDIFEEKE